MTLEPKTLISHYKILSSIGKGGMGEVFLAEDTELDRKVAIKFLSEDLSKDADKVNRFIQEAKAASALNHPNILTVYEIGTWEDTRYIATEYIEGETLRDIIRRKDPMPLNRVLKIGIQVAEALSAAHRAGIVHRDIKPENIMVREDGYVKVLDFGLAKLTEHRGKKAQISLEGKTKALVHTNPGVVMGTVNYMSPEQASGKPTDARTDLWSLGVVLYEMLSDRIPFEGKTVNHTIVSILETEPKLLENIPDELQRIIRKTLTKDKARRYQNTDDLVIDLKNLRRDLDIQGELERSIIPNKETGLAADKKSGVSGSLGEVATAPGARSTQSLSTASSLEYAVTQAKSHKLAAAAAAILLIASLGAIALISYIYLGVAEEEAAIDSVAVMPFSVSGTGVDAEYLADGLTESIIYNLSKLPDLRVLPSSTVFTFKGKKINPSEISGALDVRAVLISRLSLRGETVDISTELIDTKKNKVIWGDRFSRKVSDALSIQKEISKQISDKLRISLTGDSLNRLEKTYTVVPEAYQEYLKGRYQIEKRSIDAIQNGVGHFERAVELDPNYALAWSGLADALTLVPQYSISLPEERDPGAMAAARKAVSLGPDLAETHTSLASVLEGEFRWDEAEVEYKKAIEADPEYATAHHWYSLLLLRVGRREESLFQINKALELEPFSLIINRNAGQVFLWTRRFPQALRQLLKTQEMSADFSKTGAYLGLAYLYENNIPKALEVLEEAVAAGEMDSRMNYAVALAYSGQEAKARAILDELLQDRNAKDFERGVVCLSVGDKQEGFEFLEKARQAGDRSVPKITAMPLFDDVRGDPNYKALVKRMGL